MRARLVLAVSTLAALTACAQAAQTPTPKTDDEKALYSLGVMLSQNIRPFEFTDKEMALVNAGMADGARDKGKLEQEEMEALMPKIDQLYQDRMAAALTREKEAGTAFLDKAATEPGAHKLASGLVYKEVEAGTGAQPTAEDTVRVHYTGRFVDGKEFDTSRDSDEPAVFPLAGVIKCWGEGVQQMKVGGKAQLTCPPELAYGDQGRPPAMKGGATLQFDVELLGIEGAESESGAAASAN